MALVKGVKERLHLPLYDSLFVRPKKQLREIESSSVLKFFVNIQGKTKLETNMQSSSLLPHWNTFETRALRVVVSNLPAVFSDEVDQCLKEANGTEEGQALLALNRCLDDLSILIEMEQQGFTEKRLSNVLSCMAEFKELVEKAKNVNLDQCESLITFLCDSQTLEPILQLHSELGSIRADLIEIIRRTRIPLTKPDELKQFAEKLEQFSDTGEEKALLSQLTYARLCLEALRQCSDLIKQLKATKLAEMSTITGAIEEVIQLDKNRIQQLKQLKACLVGVQAELEQLVTALKSARGEVIRKCLNERLGDQRIVPIDEQLFGNGSRILSKLVYNSVTTFSVGEKIMIQMPTWFFPSGAGPYSEDDGAVTHGFPSPEATFRFAEPVFVDTKQYFRVEIEIPEASLLNDLQRIYGPFFIWVVLDGYMVRDVQ